MIIDNGTRVTLIIEGVFNGMAGVSGAYVSFVPNMGVRAPRVATGVLNGVPVRLMPKKDPSGPFYTGRYEAIE